MKYRHHKHPEDTYEIIGQARVQAREPLVDMEVVTVYIGKEGDLWVRRKTEFEDGRFSRVEPYEPSISNGGTDLTQAQLNKEYSVCGS